MTSKATDVQSYVKEVPDQRRPAIERLRKLCLKSLQGFEECMDYGMPCYKRNGVLEISYASQKNFIAFYVMKKDVLDEFRSSLSAAASIGKGCIRFSQAEHIDFEVVQKLLERTAESNSAPC